MLPAGGLGAARGRPVFVSRAVSRPRPKSRRRRDAKATLPRRSLAALRSLRLVDVVAALPGAPSAERLLEAVSTRHLPDAATAAGGSVPTKKLAGAAVVGLAGYKKFVAN